MINKIKTIWNLKKEYDSNLEELKKVKKELRYYNRNSEICETEINGLKYKLKKFQSKIKTKDLHVEDLQKQVKNLQKQIKDLKKDGYKKGYEKGIKEGYEKRKAEDRMVTLYLEGTKGDMQWEVIHRIVDRLGEETLSSDVSYNGSSFEWKLTEYNAGRVAHEIATKYTNVLERRADLYFKFNY